MCKGVCYNILNVKNYVCEVDIIVEVGIKGVVIIVTNMVGCGIDIKFGDDVKNVGLVVIGIECYESCRIDNQLCGCVGC